MRSLIVSASPWSCVTYTKLIPTSRWMRLSSNCIFSRSLRSSAPSGSSSSSTGGAVRERPSQRDALLLTARELPRVPLGVALELHRGQGLLHAAARPLSAASLLRSRTERHVLLPRSCAGTARRTGTPCWCRVRGRGRREASRPSTRMRPSVGVSNPASIRSVVVLPQPLGPSSEKNSRRPDVEADAVDRDDLAEALHDVVEGQRDAIAGAVLDNGRIPSDVLGLGAHVFLLMTSPADDGSSPSGSRSTPPHRTTPAT